MWLISSEISVAPTNESKIVFLENDVCVILWSLSEWADFDQILY